MFNTPDYTALINVARAYTDMREAVAEDDSDERAKKAKENDPQNKADAEAKRRRDLRKPIGGKLDKVVKDVQGKNLSSAADKVIKDVQGEDKKKKEAEEGFHESVMDNTNENKVNFFNLGKENKWEKHLNNEDQEFIKDKLGLEMKELGYI